MRALPDKITDIDLPSGHFHVDEGGYLTDPGDWNEGFAQYCAALEGVEPTEAHWKVFAFMRAYLDEHGIAADARFVLKFLAETHGTDKAGARKIMFNLFPYGYVRQACKIAGMRQPRAWSTG